jgi:dienelactone hydrolase
MKSIASAAEVLDLTREERPLPTVLHVPAVEPPWPFVVFAHGWMGHPRKFTRLFGSWVDAGYAVAAPALPFTNDTASGRDYDDVAQQPDDLRYVREHLAADSRFDAERVALAGFSLGAVTVVAAAFERSRDAEVRGVVAISGRVPSFRALEFRPCPLLVVHGRRDEAVPYADGVDIYTRAVTPKALLTIEVPGHQHYVEDEPPSVGDTVVDGVTTAFLDRVLRGSRAPQPTVASELGLLENEGVW